MTVSRHGGGGALRQDGFIAPRHTGQPALGEGNPPPSRYFSFDTSDDEACPLAAEIAAYVIDLLDPNFGFRQLQKEVRELALQVQGLLQAQQRRDVVQAHNAGGGS